MRFGMSMALAGAVSLVHAGHAAAQQREIGYPKGSLGVQAILDADYDTAERQLDDFRVDDKDPGRLINLGSIFAKTGRTESAERHFKQVLEEENVELILADGRTMPSHDIARLALSRLTSNE
ncbi:MAG: tetratricopeptide repeat protein [Sphingomonas sp.]|nr:tetratricopeptide repeat protein [Sphingomonas sp.]